MSDPVERIARIRATRPEAVAEALAARKRRTLLAESGTLFFVAADHPARGAIKVGDDPRAMADRGDLLRRLVTSLERPGVDGLLGSPDIIEDLALLGALDEKVVIGSMNRGGLVGAVFELDDRFTGYTAEAIAAAGLDGGKMLLRVADDDPGTLSTLTACAAAVDALAARGLMAMIEPFAAQRENGRAKVVLDPDPTIRVIGITSALGATSAYTWLKLPVVEEMERVMAATTLPTLLLGGTPARTRRRRSRGGEGPCRSRRSGAGGREGVVVPGRRRRGRCGGRGRNHSLRGAEAGDGGALSGRGEEEEESVVHVNNGSPVTAPVRVGLIGAGGIGSFHAESLALRVPGAILAAVADPAPGVAERLATSLGCPHATPESAELLADSSIGAVVIAAPPSAHVDLIEAAAGAGKAVFCEKPMGLTLADADRAIDAARAAGVPLQVGFNRRFAADFRAIHDLVASGRVGQPQLMRSLTRDPGIADPSIIKPWTIFLETLIHDFDTLRWLNPGAEPVEVYAVADALVRPDWKDRGLLDTALVMVRFDNGAMATAEASFQAIYGYDVRGEVFGSAGMATAGDARLTNMTFYGEGGVVHDTVRRNVDLFHDAYASELAHFVECVRDGKDPECTGEDARGALAIALAAIESVRSGRPGRIEEPLKR